MSHESNVDSAKEYIDFFLAQLAYEYEDGRLSAAEMLNACFEKLPQVAFLNYQKYTGVFLN